MDFSWTDEQSALRESVIQFSRRELKDFPGRHDAEHTFNRSGWNKCAEYGIQGLHIPACYGGGGLDALSTVAALEALGYACRDNGLIFAINAQVWGCEVPILSFGTEAQKLRCLPKLCSGEWIGGLAAAEPEAGSDAYSLRTTAVRRGDSYLLNGGKVFVTNAPVADLLVVLANVNPEGGWQGITAFLVEAGAPGLTVRPLEKMGLRSATMGEVFLEDCAVAAENRLAGEGAGVPVFTHAMEWERAFILSSAVGSMERLLEDCTAYARQRRQFGKPISQYQLVSSKLVDMKVRLETARLLLHKAAWLKDQRKSIFQESAMVKLYLSEAWVQTCMDAIQIHGGYGYLCDLGLERELRDAVGSRLYSGTSEIQRVLIAQLMGL